MTLRIKTEKMKSMLVYTLLFLASMNFGAKFFYFVFIAFLVILMQRNTRMDATSTVYLSLGCLMAIYNSDEGIMSMIRCLAPFCFYLVGMNLVSHNIGRTEEDQTIERVQKRGYMLLFTISLGSFAHYVINYIYNFGNSIGRNTIDIWSGEVLAATGQTALTCLMVGFAVAMLYLPQKKWHRILAVCFIVLMLAYNLVLASRTLLVVLVIMALVGLFYPVGTKYRLRMIIALGVILTTGILIYTTNLLGIRDMIHKSLMFERFDSFQSFINNTERTNAKLQFLSEFLKYPLGGLNLRAKYGYAHDLLLDGYDEYGIIVFGLLVAILVLGAIQLYGILRHSTYEKYFKLALLMVNISIWLEFMVEPIIEGMPWLLSCYCLINGAMTGMNRAFNRHREREKWVTG